MSLAHYTVPATPMFSSYVTSTGQTVTTFASSATIGVFLFYDVLYELPASR